VRLKKAKKTKAAAKTVRRSNSSRTRTSSRAKGASALWRAIGTGPIVAATACIVAFVGAIALVPSRNAAVDSSASAVSQQAAVDPPTETSRQSPSASRPSSDSSQANKHKKAGATPAAPDVKTAAAETATAPVEPTRRETPPTEPAARPVSTDPITSAPVEKVASVTITGCLEHDEQAFWLKDTSGDDAPTSRTWKSGFLVKRPSRIEVVDPHNSLKLPAYVGRRIAATGTLVNRELQPRSLHPLGVSCS
jgi:hypothetical protein